MCSLSSLHYSSQPVLAVIMSEMVVDWLKHGFITKFNHVKTTVYARYIDVLCKDVMLAGTTPAQPLGDGHASSRSKVNGDTFSYTNHTPRSLVLHSLSLSLSSVKLFSLIDRPWSLDA